ncbi:MAG: acyl-protein synthetase [Coriobacteriia bacterium]|nr:acyl-protein synthetase [Coriobacteriia bacterium]
MSADTALIPAGDATAWRDRLAGEVLRVLDAGVDGDPEVFEPLALQIFAYQYENNVPYRHYCDAMGATPASVVAWADIPAYPTDAFKSEVVASFETERAVQAIMTSGTTRPNQRGRIFRDETGQKLVYTANRVMTAAYLFPDFDEGQRCRILLMSPSLEIAPTMGMAIGMDQTRQAFGTPDSTFLVGRTGVDIKRLVGGLRDSQASGVPIAMIGATSAYVYFFNACREKGMSFRLPAGSRVCDGGGYRGRFGIVTRQDYYTLVEDVLGVPADMCVNTLGLGETATNYFDTVLRERVLGRASAPRRKVAPPWTRTQVFDIETRQALPPGRVGMLRHYDLCNLPTVIGVQSDNLGVMDEDGGFEIIGRAKVIEGRVQELPSEVPVGPMGDNRVFRLLEGYVNFSIEFKMGRVLSSSEKSDPIDVRREADAVAGVEDGDPTASCPIAVEEMVAGADDPGARRRSDAAIAAFQAQAADDEPARTRGDAS